MTTEFNEQDLFGAVIDTVLVVASLLLILAFCGGWMN